MRVVIAYNARPANDIQQAATRARIGSALPFSQQTHPEIHTRSKKRRRAMGGEKATGLARHTPRCFAQVTTFNVMGRNNIICPDHHPLSLLYLRAYWPPVLDNLPAALRRLVLCEKR